MLRAAAIVITAGFVLAAFSCARSPSEGMEYTHRPGVLGDESSSRVVARERVKALLIERLAGRIAKDRILADAGLSRDKIASLAAGLARMEVERETWDGSSFTIRAAIKASPREVARAMKAFSGKEGKAVWLLEARSRSAELLEEIEALGKKAAITEGGPDYLTRSRYEKAVKKLAALDWFEEGWALSHVGNHAGAADAYLRAVELNPRLVQAYVGLGEARTILDMKEEALEDFGKALALDAEEAGAYHSRGFLSASRGDYGKAVEDYGRAIELAPKNAAYYLSRGMAYYKLRNYNPSLNDFARAAALDPASEDARYGMGLVKYEQKRYAEALEALNEAVRLGPAGPGEAQAHYLRGLTLYNLKKHREAVKDFDRAIELKPDFVEAFAKRGLVRMVALKEKEKACLDWKSACVLGDCVSYDLAVERGFCK